ncbi:MAG: AAA family ATPase [bacterium]|nr:AAA family ATPase [bacterium]
MRPGFVKHYFTNFFEAVVNIFMFLPYFFSIGTLFKTLFSPWKNVITVKKGSGFSFNEWLNTASFNLISRGIGCMMRASIIFFYLFFQVFLIIFLPFILLMYILLFPAFFLIELFTLSDEQKKEQEREQFLKTHTLKQENLSRVSAWFDKKYALTHSQSQWWKLKNLQAMPPLARDWSAGYTPTLDAYATDLTHTSYRSNNYHIVDRQKEIEEIQRILSKSEEANVIIVGDEGVGKHTVIEALAQRIYEGKSTSILMYKRLLKLNMEKILSQSLDQSRREEVLSALLKEAAEAKNIIICIDNLDRYVYTDQQRVDITSAIEPFARSSQVQFIGITTPFLFQRYIAQNEKISRLFTKIDVEEIPKTKALDIILENAWLYENRHSVIVPYETIIETIEKSDFFITVIPFPEKAMKLLDDVCAYTSQTLHKKVVTPEIVDFILSQNTHTPATLTESMKEKLLNFESLLSAKVIDQHDAVNEVASALRRAFLLLGKRKKPLASFLLLGSTGVGKTETAKAITEVFFGPKNLIRFDMSLYQSKLDIATLVGSSYTGEPGLLTKAIHEHPYGVLLLDEIEKADKDLINIFLTMLDEGYLTDGFGRRVDCKNLVIIATSNAAADKLMNMGPVEQDQLASDEKSYQSFEKKFIDYLIQSHYFSPEFLNRFDGVVVYTPLQNDSVMKIGKLMINHISQELMELYKVKVDVSDETLSSMIKTSYSSSFGARDLERIIRKEIEDKIAKMILQNQLQANQSITL